MTLQPASTTCRICHSEYRLGKETTVYLFAPGSTKSYFTSTCPRCASPCQGPIFDPDLMRQSLALNNFSPCNRVVIVDEEDLNLWKEEFK